MLYLVFIFGLIFGSFLNVIIHRLNSALRQAQSGVFGRSFCPECKHQLKWYDLIPLLSFIYLRGRCYYCREKISWQYPIVEILSGFIWVAVFWKVFGDLFQVLNPLNPLNQLNPLNLLNFLNLLYFVFILSALLVIAVYDFKWKIIPDKIIYPAIIAALTYNFFKSFGLAGHLPKGENFVSLWDISRREKIFEFSNIEIFKYLNFEIFVNHLFIALAAFLFFFLIFHFSKGRAMGLGDAKLAFLIGLFLNPVLAVAAFALAFIIGAVFGIMLMAMSKISHPLFYKEWGMKSQIAFGPFLVIGVAITFLFSDFIFKFLNF